MTLSFVHGKCQHYYESGQSSPIGLHTGYVFPSRLLNRPNSTPPPVVDPDVPQALAPLPVICSLLTFPRLSRELRPLSTESDEVLAKDRLDRL
jgi:hypothetical protein